MASMKESAAGSAKTTFRPGAGVLVRRQGRTHSLCNAGYRLIVLTRKWNPCSGFGDQGEVDLKLNDDQEILPDLTTGEIGIQSAPWWRKHGDHRRGVPRRHDSAQHAQQQGYVRGSTFELASGSGFSVRFRKRGELGYESCGEGSRNTENPEIRAAFTSFERRTRIPSSFVGDSCGAESCFGERAAERSVFSHYTAPD